MFDASHKDNARAVSNAEVNPEINLGGRIRINFANRFTETALEIISEVDFKINKTQRLNYYSTQKWDIGVYDRLNFYETFSIAIRNLELNYDERLEMIKGILLKMLK